MILFEYDDYKKWVNDRISSMPNRGRGQYMRIVEHLGTSSAIVTQIFKGTRELTPEQAVLLGEYFGLTKLELKFFLLLVSYSRAASHRYKKILLEEIHELRQQAKEIKNHVPQSKELTEEAKAILYSNWYYLAIWSLTAVPGFENIDVIAQRLTLSRAKANQALSFLLKHHLVQEVDGKLQIGPTLIHLESNSPNIPRHHQNWRNKAFQKYEHSNAEDVFYTAPVTLSEKDAQDIRAQTLAFISRFVKQVSSSPSEKLYCFCLDWFEV